MQVLPSLCAPLRALCLRDVPWLDDRHVSAVLACARSLEHLDLTELGSSQLHGTFLTSASTASPSLQALRIHGRNLGRSFGTPNADEEPHHGLADRLASYAVGRVLRAAPSAMVTLSLCTRAHTRGHTRTLTRTYVRAHTRTCARALMDQTSTLTPSLTVIIAHGRRWPPSVRGRARCTR